MCNAAKYNDGYKPVQMQSITKLKDMLTVTIDNTLFIWNTNFNAWQDKINECRNSCLFREISNDFKGNVKFETI